MFKILSIERMKQMWEERVHQIEEHLYGLYLNRGQYQSLVDAQPDNAAVKATHEENEKNIAAAEQQLQGVHDMEPTEDDEVDSDAPTPAPNAPAAA